VLKQKGAKTPDDILERVLDGFDPAEYGPAMAGGIPTSTCPAHLSTSVGYAGFLKAFTDEIGSG
jgi:hypothetical protein